MDYVASRRWYKEWACGGKAYVSVEGRKWETSQLFPVKSCGKVIEGGGGECKGKEERKAKEKKKRQKRKCWLEESTKYKISLFFV